jgi:hypothetical protein
MSENVSHCIQDTVLTEIQVRCPRCVTTPETLKHSMLLYYVSRHTKERIFQSTEFKVQIPVLILITEIYRFNFQRKYLHPLSC